MSKVNDIDELDTVITNDNVIWLVHGKIGNDLVVRPKYIPDDSATIKINHFCYKRLFSPIFDFDVREPVLLRYRKYDKTGLYCNLFLLDSNEIVKVIKPTFNISFPDSLLDKVANSFVENIKQVCDCSEESVGICGSLALGSEIDGYSDINIRIKGEKNIQKFIEKGMTIPNVHYRDKTELFTFYYKYDVRKPDINQFIQLSLTSRTQGFVEGIPFSIFPVHENLPVFEMIKRRYASIKVQGQFVRSERLYEGFPMRGNLVTCDKVFKVIVWDRFFCKSIKESCKVEIEGLISDDLIVVKPKENGIRFM